MALLYLKWFTIIHARYILSKYTNISAKFEDFPKIWDQIHAKKDAKTTYMAGIYERIKFASSNPYAITFLFKYVCFIRTILI